LSLHSILNSLRDQNRIVAFPAMPKQLPISNFLSTTFAYVDDSYLSRAAHW